MIFILWNDFFFFGLISLLVAQPAIWGLYLLPAFPVPIWQMDILCLVFLSPCASTVPPSSPPWQPKGGQDLERCHVHLLIIRKFTCHDRRWDRTRYKQRKCLEAARRKETHLFFFWLISLWAAFVTMLLQGSSVGVWIGWREGTSRWTSYSNWSPVEPKSYFTVRKRFFTPQTNSQCRTCRNITTCFLCCLWLLVSCILKVKWKH